MVQLGLLQDVTLYLHIVVNVSINTYIVYIYIDGQPTSKKVTVDGIFCYKQKTTQNIIIF
jgi:hypothetical protein